VDFRRKHRDRQQNNYNHVNSCVQSKVATDRVTVFSSITVTNGEVMI